MRFRHVVAIVVVVVAFSLIGQEEPLPVVTPHVEATQIALAVEPILDPPKPSLAGAAHANDFATFDALYRDAQRRGENVAAYATLHDLWTYSVTDPIGAFYGQAMHDRFARTYPGYAAFIEEHRIVDSRGNVYYPTSETRAFLLERAEAGVSTPSPVRIAEHHRAEPTTTAPAPVQHRTRTHRAAAAPAPAPAPAKPVVVVKKQVPAPVPVAVAEVTPVPVAPVVITPPPPVEKTAEKIATPPAAIAAKPASVPVSSQKKNGADRGLLLVIVGLIGIGLLALILRAPREEMPSVITPEPPAATTPHQEHR